MIHHHTSKAAQVSRKRRRTPRSCEECRRSKTKCDRNEPCSHCILTGKPCFYGVRPATADFSPPGIVPNQQSQHQDSALGKDEQELEWLRSQVRRLEEALHQHTSRTNGGAIRTPALSHLSESHDTSPQEGPIILNKSRLFGQSHWTNTAALEFRRIATILNGEVGAFANNTTVSHLISENRILLQRCKVLSKARKALERGNGLPAPDLRLQINKLRADHMVQLYVSHFESAFRILHVPLFWTEYERFWESIPTTTSTSTLQLKVQLVVALGSSLHHDTSNETTSPLRAVASQWLCAAQQWLSTPFEKDRLSLDSLQIHCLLVLARQALAIGGDLIYIEMGTVLRTAMQIGLHRDPRHFKSMSLFDSEMRKRLWATILELDLQASLDAGMPPNLSLDDFDAECPSSIDDIEISRDGNIPQKDNGDIVTDTSLQRHMSSSLRLRYDIVKRMNGTDSFISYDEIRIVTGDINSICRDIKSHVKGNGPEAVFRYNLADMLIRRLLLCVHRPLASQSHANPELYFSRKVSLDAAMAILSPAQNEEFSLLIHVGGGIFKHRMIHLSLALAAELLRELRETGTTPEPTAYRRMVVDAAKEALRQTAERIRFGETNADIKMHLKLSMVLCQANDTNSSSAESSLLLMAQSAKESLEWSHSILQARAPQQMEEGTTINFDDADLQGFALGPDFDFDDIFGILDIENTSLTNASPL